MNNNGYTKIPNAIIRLATISPSERSAWCLIASLPHGYALSTTAACAELDINPKTWRQCIAVLKQRGMITVESVPGHANVYGVTGAENWDTTPAKNWYTQKTAPLPKNGTPPMPKNGRGTHYNKKDHLKNIVVADAHTHTREDFIADALNDLRVEQGCMAMRITPDEYRQLVTEVTNDWIFRNIHDNEWTLTHLLAQMRIKHNINNRNNGNNQPTGNADSIRAKLDADAVKAMAALAAEIGKPKVVPF